MKRAILLAGLLAVAFAVGQGAGYVGDREWVPIEIQGTSLIGGCITALYAVGLVLVYRASRIINFAHAGLGIVGGILFYVLVQERDWPYFAALAAGVAAATALGAAVELLFIRRFFTSSRLILTVVTIGIGQLLIAFAGKLPEWLVPYEVVARRLPESPIADTRVTWGVATINGNHYLLIGATVVLLLLLAAFFRFSSAGIAIRGAAENDDRATLMGINVRSLSTLVWIFAGVLAGASTVLTLAVNGAAGQNEVAGIGTALLLRALAAAVIARMEHLPTAVVASLALSVFESSVFWGFGDTSVVDIAVFVLVLGGLLLQRKRLARAEDTGTTTWSAGEEIRPVPNELAGMGSVQAAGRRFVVLLGALVLAFPWVASPAQTSQGALFAIFGVVAVSLVILMGWGGQISLGQFGFAAVGAMIGGAATSRWGLPFPVALLLGSIAGGLVAALVGLPALRIRGLFLAVTTLSFSVVCANVLLNPRYFDWLLPERVERPQLFFVDFEDARAFFYLCVAAVLFSVWAATGLRRSRTGRVLIAMRDNERSAQSFGVNLVRVRLVTFAMSGFLAAMAGVLYANHLHAVNQAAFPAEMSVRMFLMAIIGGLGSVTGVLLGAVYIGMVSIIFPSQLASLLASGAGVLLLLMFFPSGLGGMAFAVRDAFLRRVAIRNRIYVPSLLGNTGLAGGEMTKVPLAQKYEDERTPHTTRPRRYQLRSRIAVTGGSQGAKGWRF